MLIDKILGRGVLCEVPFRKVLLAPDAEAKQWRSVALPASSVIALVTHNQPTHGERVALRSRSRVMSVFAASDKLWSSWPAPRLRVDWKQ